MWKKALWIYTWLYVVVLAGGILYQVYDDIRGNEFQIISLIFPLVMFIPAWAVLSGLKGEKVSILLIILGLLIMAIPVAGIFNFNEMNWQTVAKALLFVPMIVGLLYFGYMRLQKKEG